MTKFFNHKSKPKKTIERYSVREAVFAHEIIKRCYRILKAPLLGDESIAIAW